MDKTLHPDLPELSNIRKRISVGYFYAIITIFSIFTIYYWYESIEPFNYIVSIGLFFNCFCFFVIFVLSYDIFRPLVFVYLVFISIVMYPMALLFWQLGQITILMWLFLIPTASMIFYTSKGVFFWIIYILVLICSIFCISAFFPEAVPVLSITDSQLLTINILTVFSFFFLLFYFLYGLDILNKEKVEIQKHIDLNSISIGHDITASEIDRFNEIFHNIINYFNKKKPYCNPDFTVSQLATAIDSNITYVSKAIKLNRDMNFNNFVNVFRTDMVKEMINDDYHNKYTMRYIYTNSGFRHQSTFNKVFKQNTGVTPSEYIRTLAELGVSADEE